MIITRNLVRSYLEYAGFRGTDLDNAVRICRCESSFDTEAHNTRGEDSRGLMQINLDAHPEYSNLDLFDPTINTVIAYKVYKESGYSFRAWTCATILGIVDKKDKKPDEKIIVIAIAFLGAIVLYYI